LGTVLGRSLDSKTDDNDIGTADNMGNVNN
jgi:hypothetical protein